MSNDLDLDLIRETYGKMTDAELIRVATTDTVGLTDEAYDIVKQEISRRGLSENIQRGVNIQRALPELSPAELDRYCELIQRLPCPVSGSNDVLLNATCLEVRTSFILFTQVEKSILIACPDELDRANMRAIIATSLLGWWSLHGFFYNFITLFRNIRNRKVHHLADPNQYLLAFVRAHIGEIETHRNNPEKLSAIIHGRE